MSGHRVAAPSLRMNRRELAVRVQSHRQTGKESNPVAGFHAMKTGETRPKPAGDRNIFSLWIAMQTTVTGCPRRQIFA
jgi:hypothetical protein